MPSTRMNRTMLERENISFQANDDEILAFGNRVDEFANMHDAVAEAVREAITRKEGS